MQATLDQQNKYSESSWFLAYVRQTRSSHWFWTS